MNRAELWTVSSGVYATKPRPAIIIQDDLFRATSSVTIVPLTATVADAPIARIPVPADATTGIAQPSFAMIDKITAVRRTNLRERVGRVPTSLLADIERSIMVFLGLLS